MGTHSGTQDNAGSWAGGMYAITLFAEDLAAAREFYQDVLELPLVFEDPNSAVFRLGDTLLNLLKISEARELIEPARVAGRDAGSRMVFTIRVDDVDARVAALAERGLTMLNGPMDRPWGVRTASFMDPAGNIWELAK